MTGTQCSDPRVPPSTACVVRDLIDHWAAVQPEQTYAIFEDGSRWSYATLREQVTQVAAGLHARGVRQGDHVAVWLFGGAEGILSFFAINYLGAVFVPLRSHREAERRIATVGQRCSSAAAFARCRVWCLQKMLRCAWLGVSRVSKEHKTRCEHSCKTTLTEPPCAPAGR